MKKQQVKKGAVYCTPEQVAGLTLVHYGSSSFSKKRFRPIRDKRWIKPDGGLWTSPVGSKWGWKDWCEAEEFRECREEESFQLRFVEGARVVLVDCYEHLSGLPLQVCEIPFHEGAMIPDFGELARCCDALWLTEQGEAQTRWSHPLALYGWDCETVLVLNPDCVQPVERRSHAAALG